MATLQSASKIRAYTVKRYRKNLKARPQYYSLNTSHEMEKITFNTTEILKFEDRILLS